MVGLLERVADRVPSHFAAPGDEILVLGATRGELGGSAYWAELCDFIGGPPARRWISTRSAGSSELLVAAARRRLLRSAHDCSDGGLLVALAEAAIGGAYATRGLSAPRSTSAATRRAWRRRRCSTARTAPAPWSPRRRPTSPRSLALAGEHGVPAYRAGRVGEREAARWNCGSGHELFSWAIGALRQTYFTAIPRRMQHPDVDRSAGE